MNDRWRELKSDEELEEAHSFTRDESEYRMSFWWVILFIVGVLIYVFFGGTVP